MSYPHYSTECHEYHSVVKDFPHGERRPSIVCLCGSTRFSQQFREANFKFTLQGYIVLSVGCDTKLDAGLALSDATKKELDQLHMRKIDLCDFIFVLNVDGYIGESTQNEINYARSLKKQVNFLEDYIEAFPKEIFAL